MIKYVCIEGNIGVGKSSIAFKLAEELGGHFLPEEFEENPLLPLFYKEPAKFAFPVEFSFLLDRFRQQKKWDETINNGLVISDYYFEKCLYFAKLNLSKKDYPVFEEKFNTLNEEIKQPELLVFIRLEIELLQKNVKKRNRSYEQSIPDDYLIRLNQHYIDAINIVRKHRVLSFILSNNEQSTYDAMYRELKSFILKPSDTNFTEIHL